MSVKVQFAALADALAKDLRGQTPYKMASMAGYGRVGGYSLGYAELRRDIFEFFDLCRRMAHGSVPENVEHLPPLVRNRMMSERFFLEERDILQSAIAMASKALRAASETRMTIEVAAADDMFRNQFAYLLRRAGVKLEPSSARREIGSVRAAARPATGVGPRPMESGDQAREATPPAAAAGRRAARRFWAVLPSRGRVSQNGALASGSVSGRNIGAPVFDGPATADTAPVAGLLELSASLRQGESRAALSALDEKPALFARHPGDATRGGGPIADASGVVRQRR